MMEESSRAEQEQKSKELLHKELEAEAITERKRIIREEHRRIRIEARKGPEEVESSVHIKPSIPKPLTIRLKLEFHSVKVEPRVRSPASIPLNDKQRTILYMLYHIFKGKNLRDVLSIISSILGCEAEDILNEIMKLENLKLITVSNGVISFTHKGETIVGDIAIDRDIVRKVRELIYKVPKIPCISIPHVAKKFLDKQSYLATVVRVSRKELAVPRVPKICINMPIPIKTNRNVNMIFKKEETKVIPVPRVPRIASPKLSAKPLSKTTLVPLEHKIEEKSATGGAGKSVTITLSKRVRLPSSLLTMLFKPVKKHGVKELIKVRPDRPVIIVAVKPPNDDYIATLLSILRELYRMKVGGLPVGRYTGTKVTKYIAEDELIRQGLIKVIDDSKADFLEFFGISKIEDFDKIDLNKLRDRLIELSVQGLSFLVFYVDRSKANSILTYLASLRDKIAPAKVVIILPRELSVEQKRELARAAWGFVDPKEPLINDTIDQHFKHREEEFYDLLEKIATKRKYVKIVKESHEEDEEEGLKGVESTLHYQLKVFVVYYLMKKLKIPEEDVETEFELSANGKKVIPDVYVKSKSLAIEIETFYGTGVTPWRKLQRTIEKYIGSKIANEVWIVIPPLQAMLYLKDLVSEIRELKEKGYSYIKLYTVDLSKKRLVPIKKILRRLNVKLFAKSL